jgi:long-subunit acyl-CoA synthetase (AMP-forming)
LRSFFHRLSRQAEVAGGKRALTEPGAHLSYAQLVAQIRGAAKWAAALPARVGLICRRTVDAVVADLALAYAGKELVPLPDFFSDAQLLHMIGAARLSDAVADSISAERLKRLGLSVWSLGCESTPALEPASDSARIIFTSGTTGRPKGVHLSAQQMLASVDALARATLAAASDRYLSLLPGALLLEQIAGTYLPLSVGAEIHLPGALPPASIAAAAQTVNPTATVLVPELLAAWLAELQTLGCRAPASLRYVAIGGAPVSSRLAAAAWERGVPVHEGYGLSECCSVVAVNRPGRRRAGTVGTPLLGVEVTIEDGEILVGGPTVMNGYLDEPLDSGLWHTGDLGHFNEDGFLVVTGRRDNLIVTAAGRNISPEWIEEAITANCRIRRCVVIADKGELVAVIAPHDSSLLPGSAELKELIADAGRDLPDYAKPRRCLVLSEREFRALDLLTPNSRPRRSAIHRLVRRSNGSFYPQLGKEERCLPI